MGQSHSKLDTYIKSERTEFGSSRDALNYSKTMAFNLNLRISISELTYMVSEVNRIPNEYRGDTSIIYDYIILAKKIYEILDNYYPNDMLIGLGENLSNLLDIKYNKDAKYTVHKVYIMMVMQILLLLGKFDMSYREKKAIITNTYLYDPNRTTTDYTSISLGKFPNKNIRQAYDWQIKRWASMDRKPVPVVPLVPLTTNLPINTGAIDESDSGYATAKEDETGIYEV